MSWYLSLNASSAQELSLLGPVPYRYHSCNRKIPPPDHAPVSSVPNRILLDYAFDSSLIFRSVLLKQVVRLSLRGRVGIRIVQEILYAQCDLLDGDGRLPALLFVQDGQADGAGRVDVGMEQRWGEFALWRLRGILWRVTQTSVSVSHRKGVFQCRIATYRQGTSSSS